MLESSNPAALHSAVHLRPRGYGIAMAAGLALLASLLATGAVRADEPASKPPEPPASPDAVIAPSPELPHGKRETAAEINWTEGAARRFLWRPGKVWLVVPESAVTGWVVIPGERRPIRQTRLRIEEDRPGKNTVLAWLQHTANTEVSILFPGDPRLRSPGPAVDDTLRPWPNACTLLPYDLDRGIDLNRNDRMELALSSSASVPDPAASRILLLEADASGKPRLVKSSEFVGTIRFDSGIITAIHFQAGAKDPKLEGELLSLYSCRFLAQLDIPGQEACRNCCRVGIELHRDEAGIFQPVYDKETQRGLLDRLRADLSTVQTGGTGPLSPPEQAALARAGAFFYLTGSGRKTRVQLVKALGARATLPQSVQLLNRLDEMFLRPAS